MSSDMVQPIDAELVRKLRGAVSRYEEQGRELLNRNPLESLAALVLGGAAVYYMVERGRNEKVVTYWDALEYVSTCASVGYSNIFPNTPLGKIVASALFLVGPNLSSRVLDPLPSDSHEEKNEPALIAKLDEILAELRRG